MPRAVEVVASGTWAEAAVDTVVLDYDARHRRRLAMRGVNGFEFLLDLQKAATLDDGDGLRLDDGAIVAVRAAAERLLEITCDDPRHMVRLAWHLGNRHLPTAIEDGCLRIREDHVIAEMARGLGANVRTVEAPFRPEGGAYAGGQGHHPHHHHHHSHGPGHAHG